MPRNYKQEYERYHKSPEQKKRRAMRNKVRRQALKEGRVRKGDRIDIHHIDGNPMNFKKSNLRLQDRSKALSYSK